MKWKIEYFEQEDTNQPAEFFGFDKERIVLLHGYAKRTGQPASTYDLEKAFTYWREYLRTRCVSPIQEED